MQNSTGTVRTPASWPARIGAISVWPWAVPEGWGGYAATLSLRDGQPPDGCRCMIGVQFHAQSVAAKMLSRRQGSQHPGCGPGNRSHTLPKSRDGFAILASLRYDVWIAANDRGRNWQDGKLGDGCLTTLPNFTGTTQGAESVRLIDVLWLDKDTRRIVAAFEVEHSTTIYSGIVRMLDLALGVEAHALEGLFLVAPDKRGTEVREQIRRPAFSRITDLKVRYLPYGALEKNRGVIAKFGHGLKPIHAISHLLTPA
ncbi:hypothetical protein [Acetobacter conturbans]|nr:hypothetical protein [Acetobacter conturbans]